MDLDLCGLLPVDELPELDSLPDQDFLEFLGELADPLVAGPLTTQVTPGPQPLPPIAVEAAGPVALQLPTWHMTPAVVHSHQSQPQHSRGSSCSSEASALPDTGSPSATTTLCPPSPTSCAGPTASSDATAAAAVASLHSAPSTAGSGASTRSSSRRQARTQQQQQQPQGHDQQEDQEQQGLTKAQLAAAKRRAPVVDWKAIDDPEERRKQRRLAKNRVTAAR